MSGFAGLRALLPEAGEVVDEAELERIYEHPSPEHLRINFVSSLDGGVEIDGRSGPLGGPADRSAFMAMRAVTDVVMVGAGTARAENYGPVRLGEGPRRRRLQRDQSERPPLAVVTARADLDPAARMFEADRQIIVLTSARSAGSRPDLAELAEVVPCGDVLVDLGVAVGELRRRGFGRVLCEGGPSLMRSLLTAGLVDELCLTFAPVLAGPHSRRLSGDAPPPQPESFRLAGLLEGDGMLLARYQGPLPL